MGKEQYASGGCSFLTDGNVLVRDIAPIARLLKVALKQGPFYSDRLCSFRFISPDLYFSEPMDRLPSSTLRRLKQLPQQSHSVWESDRLEFGPHGSELELPSLYAGGHAHHQRRADCIIWVDGIEQTVRTIEAVPPSDGPEAYVRALIKAIEAPMEMPQMPMARFRPQKVVVRDRELQFFLRGILKDLEIEVEYHSNLPLIDEMAPSLRQLIGMTEENLPDELYDLLEEKATQIWTTAPWKELLDHQILKISLPLFDLPPFYLSVMGNMGVEYGLLLYRSIDSLKAFRQSAIDNSENLRIMQEAFLNQDCLFLNFERGGGEEDGPLNLMELLQGSSPLEDDDEIDIELGSINPLEGIRPQLDEEEAIAMILALEAIHRFFRKNRRQFRKNQFPPCSGKFRIALPAALAPEEVTGKTVTVQIETLPKLTDELWAMNSPAPNKVGMGDSLAQLLNGPMENITPFPEILDELIPHNALTFIGRLDWEMYDLLCEAKGRRSQKTRKKIHRKGEGFPVFIVQTSRPKAKVMQEKIAAAGGISGLGFCPVQDMDNFTPLEVGLIHLSDGSINVFNDYDLADARHQETKRRWESYSQGTRGICGFIIATGATGASRGELNLRTMTSLYETEVLQPTSIPRL